MHVLFILAATAFLLCLVTTPLVRDISLRAGMVDHPDGDRKFHLRAVPRIGGIPIVFSYAASLGLVFFFHPGGNKLYVQHDGLLYALLPGAAIIFCTGLLDDFRGLKPSQKLAGQVAAAVLAVSLGARLAIPKLAAHLDPHVYAWVCGIVSVAWLIACTNAVNLIDGMDGLATGVGLLATISTLMVALLSRNFGLALATVPLVGSLLAFLRYNFSPASVFLGDCGSLTIGFVLGCFGLIWSQRTGTMLGMVAPLMALSLPLIDVVLAIGRRFLRSVPILRGDRGHIHHRVLALGLSTRSAALLLYTVCGISASLAIIESFSRRGFGWSIVVVFCCLVLVGIDRLGYVEFVAARKALSQSRLRRAVQDHIFMEELRHSLQQARTVEEWWAVVCQACSHLRLASAHLTLNGTSYKQQFTDSSITPNCRIHLRLGEGSFLVVTRVEENVPPRHMMAVLHLLRASVQENDFPFGPPAKAVAPSTVLTSNAA